MKFVVVSVDYSQIMAIHTEEEVLKMCANDERMYNDVVRAVKSRAQRADGKSLWYIVEDDEIDSFKEKLKTYYKPQGEYQKERAPYTKQIIAKDMPFEEWKEIEDFPNYRVSNYGRIKSVKNGKILKGQTNYNCYAVALCNKEKGLKKQFNIANLVMNAFKPLDIDTTRLHVKHRDGDMYNNRLENLEWIL